MNRKHCSAVAIVIGVIGLLAIVPILVAKAQTAATPVVPGYYTTTGCPSGQTVCFNPYVASSGAFSAATIGTSSSQVIAAGTAKSYIMLHNPSAPGGNIVYCEFGGTPTVAGAKSLSISPGQFVTFESSFVPNDVLNCIASGASTPFTYGVH